MKEEEEEELESTAVKGSSNDDAKQPTTVDMHDIPLGSFCLSQNVGIYLEFVLDI